MRPSNHETQAHRLRIGSLFSGYGGLDLAVEEVFDGETAWFSEFSPAVARVFSHHWPGVPNLGDITTIDWSQVEPVDVLCGGFPCQDVSTVGRMAGLHPGTRSGLWARTAEAIAVLQPEWVVAENVRGLLSATATRPNPEGDNPDGRNPSTATPEPATEDAAVRGVESDPWHLGDQSTRPLRALGAVLGDLADLRYDTRWLGLPASDIGAPHTRFRIFILARRTVPDATGLGCRPRRGEPGSRQGPAWDDRPVASGHRPGSQRAGRLPANSRSGVAVAAHRTALRRWGRYALAIRRWEHLTGRVAPSPTLISDDGQYRPAPRFVEWLMGLPEGWVTDSDLGLTLPEQLPSATVSYQPRLFMRSMRCVELTSAADRRADSGAPTERRRSVYARAAD
ncbi:DNA cytosine methyltransferase [Leucobacter weissii]|uniref:DNA cytosine methyltransferase n=1 Tax=Leucobacter weissii TaxID=1983706 RepID=UPI001FB67399|nr:DNA cytosine methyltransferase [Leucobacter weissii]